jgi:hypothetical protein
LPLDEVIVELVSEVPEPGRKSQRHDHPIGSPPARQVDDAISQEESDPKPPPGPEPQAESPSASDLQSRSILANPRSKQAREVLAQTEAVERATQLCNLEAMAQINGRDKSMKSEFVNAEATAPVALRGAEIEAPGAAYRSHDKWFRLKFICKLNRLLDQVIDIRIDPGALIPRRDWARYSLMIDDHPMHD